MTKNTEEFVAEWHKSYANAKAFFVVVSEGFSDIYNTIGDIMGDIGGILDGMWSWNKTLMALEQGFAAISLFVKGIRLGILGLQLSEAHLGKMTGYASDLTKEEEKRYDVLKKNREFYDEQSEDYKELIALQKKSTGTSNEKILKIEKEIAEVRKEAGEQTYKFTVEGRKESEARFTAIQKEYSLITAIRNSSDMWELTASYTAAKEQARDTLEVQQKIDDVYGEQLRKIEIAAKLKEVLAKGGNVAEETNKTTSKALAKQQRDQDKLLKDWNDSLDDLREEYEEWSTRFADTFASAFDQALNGDVFGAFANMFDQIGSELMKPFVDNMSKQLSSMLSNLTSGLGELGSFGLGLVGMGIGLAIDSIMQDEVATPPELTDLADTSDSMLNALNSIEDVQYPMLELTRNMTDYLKTISMSFGSVGNSLTRSGIDFGGGSFIPTSKTGTLFGSDSTDLYGTSLTFDPATVGSLLAGDLNAYRTDVIEWVKTTWYGRKKVRYIEDVTDISELIAEDLQNATEAVFSGLIGAGGYLGIDTSSLLGRSINLGQLDTTGMSGDEIAAELEGRFSAQVDAIAEDLFGVLIPFQEAGEGLAETLFRITYETEQASQMFSMVGKYISGWEESATILQQSGGLGAFTANMNDFMALFTDEQQQEMKIAALTEQFTALGYALPATNEAFIDLVNRTTDPKLYADLLSLSGAFGDLGLELEEIVDNTYDLEAANAALVTYQEQLLAFNEDILNRIVSAYSGSLNYMNSLERSAALAGLAQNQFDAGNTQGYFDTLYQQLEADKAVATTREQYALSFDKYIAELQGADFEEKTTEDVIITLEELIEQNKRIEQVIVQAAYQAPLNTAYTGV